MRRLLFEITLWIIPLIFFLPALWVLLDMMRDSWVELREWWRRVRS